jgi:micrococcal nuclease
MRFFISFLFLFPAVVLADVLECDVTRVVDGDTLYATCQTGDVKIRLANIDAPEYRFDTPEQTQPFGYESRQALAKMCFFKKAIVHKVTVDQYGRIVAVVFCDGVETSKELVKNGLAWVYTQYNTDPLLPSIEEEAKANKRGLWADPVAPWEFRRQKH